jgi:hypothetical protein
MDRKRLDNLRRERAALRRSPQKATALQSFAERLGRKRVGRGKEPTYVSDAFPNLRPLSIPGHKGRDLAIGTKNSILNQLDDDLTAWEEWLDSQERGNGDGSEDDSG